MRIMYQFYYSDQTVVEVHPIFERRVEDVFAVRTVRPTMWEEHCLECAAPLCYQNCLHYSARSDGRCKRLENGMSIYSQERGCCGEGVHIHFRKWANMMTIIFPAMLSVEDYNKLCSRNRVLGKCLARIANSRLPVFFRWESIRTLEFLRRQRLKKMKERSGVPDAFIFHGFSHCDVPFHLNVEVFDDHTPLFKTSMLLQPGENLFVIECSAFSKVCWTAGNLIKVYPENDLEVALDILWCDFVQGERVVTEKPSAHVKCVVWDLDNTLWKGTLIESEDLSELTLNEGVMDLIRALDERGIIQSIASKNDYDPAWEHVKALGIEEYFLYPQIHWNAKSRSIAEIAKDLNIGIDALALIDDSAFEREEVRSEWPQVRTYDATEIESLLDRPEFDVPITTEGRKRRAMYRAEEQRNTLMKAEHADIVDFLRKCNLKMHIFIPTTEEEKLRCYELIVRTNQLNMSGRKYTPEEFGEVLGRIDHKSFAFSCADNFGEYGIVGVGQYRIDDDVLIFTEFAMSCRVAGKFVESALFARLLENENCRSGSFVVRKTKKNALLRNTLEQIGFQIQHDSGESVSYVFTANMLNSTVVGIV